MDYVHNFWDMDNHDYCNDYRIIKSPPEVIQQLFGQLSKVII